MSIAIRLRALSDALNRTVVVLCVGCVLAMLSISFVGFFYMAITGAALSWTYSLARLFIPWIGMLSITVAFKSGEHVAMAAALRMLPARAALWLRYVSLALIALFALLLVWHGWGFFDGSTQYFMVSDQLQVHYRWVAACMPATGLVLLVHLASGLDLLEPLEPVADDAADTRSAAD
jgi:TRAP-type C4-dicarboxylate transport system permease small subunit